MALVSVDSDRKLPNYLLPVVLSRKSKKLTSKIIPQTLKFTSTEIVFFFFLAFSTLSPKLFAVGLRWLADVTGLIERKSGFVARRAALSNSPLTAMSGPQLRSHPVVCSWSTPIRVILMLAALSKMKFDWERTLQNIEEISHYFCC